MWLGPEFMKKGGVMLLDLVLWECGAQKADTPMCGSAQGVLLCNAQEKQTGIVVRALD